MAKVKEKRKVGKKTYEFPLKKANYLIISVGILLLILGYVFMSLPDDPDAFLSRTLAPILLVIAYLIVIPIGIMYRGGKAKTASQS